LLRPEFLDLADQGLRQISATDHGVDIILGHPRRAEVGLMNAASWIGNGQILATYHKQLLPNYAVFDEKRYFAAGDGACVLQRRGVRVGITICEDIWEAGPAETATRLGAEVLVNLNASPFHIHKIALREQVLRERIGENRLPIVYVNLVGGQDELVFDGSSRVINGEGELVCSLPPFCETLGLVEFQRQADSVVVLPGSVTDSPPMEAMVYQALVLGVRDYVTKNGFHGVVLGLSGGVDSALTLAVAVDALGASQVEAVLLPSRYTAIISNEDAARQCDNLDVRYQILSIEPAFTAFIDTLSPVFQDLPVDTTEENIQARCRGIILMAISNKTGRLVLSTSNKSETAVGYSTLYGDMAGGFAPIKDVPKTLVYRLARYRNTLGAVIPERVLERPPSAELRPDQKDQDSLPPYEVLDPILNLYVESDRSIEEIVAAGYARADVERVARLVILNEYKRRQAAPGVRITPRAFGRDRRYPITSGFRC